MKHPQYFIAVDLGATSGRVILATAGQERIELEELHRFTHRMTEIGGKYYWDIYALYDHIKQGLSAAGRRKLPVTSIGIDTWGVDFAYIARDGSLLGLPRAYRDPYTEGIPGEFFEKMSRRELYERTGTQIMNFNSLFQLYAARKEEASALAHADSILFMPDVLSYLLTGQKVCEYTILSTSQLMNLHTQRPDPELLGIAGVSPSLFARTVFPGERIGELTPALARETGLGQTAVIAVAGHDTGSAVAAVPAADRNFAYLSSGTWSLMGIEVPGPIVTEESHAMNFTNEGGVDGTVRFLKNITGMWLLEQCREAWACEGRTYTYEQIMQMTHAAPPSRQVIDPDDRQFAAPTHMPRAIRDYCTEHDIPTPDDDSRMMRLIFDSLAAKYAVVLEKLRAMAPFPIERLHVIGGGAHNDMLNQMTADACGIPVWAGPAEATALGNVMVQARAAGVVGSLAEMRRYIRLSTQIKEYQPKK